MKSIFIVSALLFFSFKITFCQNYIVASDTINIYKSKAGINFRKYLKEWRFIKGHSFSFFLSDMNKQDSIVMNSSMDKIHYYKIHRKKDRIWFEGIVEGELGFSGECKYYNRKEKVKKTEYWYDSFYKDTCTNQRLILSDAPTRGSIQYFRMNGTIKKEIKKVINVSSCTPLKYSGSEIIKKFWRNGTLKSNKESSVRKN
jgi:hypothetical protein